jgi:polygalacturonase
MVRRSVTGRIPFLRHSPEHTVSARLARSALKIRGRPAEAQDVVRRDRRGFLGAGLAAPRIRLAGAPVPAQASGATGVFDVTRFGAVRDGGTVCTAGLQRAIDACGAAGGGTVLVPAGCYLTGALFLRSHVHLALAAGATLACTDVPEHFPPVKSRDEGVDRMVHASLLTGVDLEGVTISGPGLLDGRGQRWWKAHDDTRKLRLADNLPREAENPPGSPLRWPRPRMINLIRCRGVLIEGVTVMDGPGTNVHLLYCEDVAIDRIVCFQNHLVSSSDAIIVDSTRRVSITRCRLSAGADSIGIKSGYNEEGRRIGRPSEDVVIESCHLYKTSSGVVIGSETSGGVRNVVVSDCVIHACLSGIRIRAPRGRGGVVEKVRVSNLIIDGAEEMAIKISHFFDSIRSEGLFIKPGPARGNLELARSRKALIDEGTPTFRDFTFSGLTLSRMHDVALVEGLPERFIQGLVFADITASQVPAGIACTMAADVTISNFAVDALDWPAVDAREVERLEVHRLRCPRPPADAPLVWLENVSQAYLHGCAVGSSPGEWLQQEQSRQITVAENHLPPRSR